MLSNTFKNNTIVWRWRYLFHNFCILCVCLFWISYLIFFTVCNSSSCISHPLHFQSTHRWCLRYWEYIHPNSVQQHTFYFPLSMTAWVRQYQKGKTILDFTEARDCGWHYLDHLHIIWTKNCPRKGHGFIMWSILNFRGLIHIWGMIEARAVKFCTQGDYIMSCQRDDKSTPPLQRGIVWLTWSIFCMHSCELWKMSPQHTINWDQQYCR